MFSASIPSFAFPGQRNFLKASDIHIKDLLKLLFLLLDNKLINKKRLQKQFIQLK